MTNNAIQAWLFQSAAIFVMLGSIVAIIVGAMMVFSSQHFQRISALLNRWVSTRNFDKSLESSYSVDPWLYRYHRQAGAALLLGVLYILYYFVVQLDRDAAIQVIAKNTHYPPSLLIALLDAGVLIALLGAMAALFVGLFLMLRPSLLRGFESGANQWVSMRKALKPLEVQHDVLGKWVDRHLRQFGLFLMLGGVYVFVTFLIWLPSL